MKIKQVNELKPNDIIRDVKSNEIRTYEYLCVHPRNKKYYILINENADPFRLYETELQHILNKGLNTAESAKLMLVSELESYILFLTEL